MRALQSRNGSGLVVALLVLFMGAAAIVAGGVGLAPWAGILLRVVGGLIVAFGLALTGGASYHLVRVYRFRRTHPAPGRLIDVGGYRMHLIAEGENHGSPTVVWIPGSHDQGMALWALHRRLAQESRSIIYDRAGSGWSDTGPFPFTITREVDELEVLLRGAGEKGPFVLAGHSAGGFVAANFADRFPEQTAGVVLMDSGEARGSVFTSRLPENRVPGAGDMLWAMAALGLLWGRGKKMPERVRQLYKDYGDVADILLADSAMPRTPVVFSDMLRCVWTNPYDMVAVDGALGDVPLFSIIPAESTNANVLTATLRPILKRLPDVEFRNYLRMRMDSPAANARLSTRGQLHVAPAGTTHHFVYEVPDYTLDQVREMQKWAVAEGRVPKQ